MNGKLWIQTARPKTLLAAVGPVLMGAALAFAADCFHFFSVLAALFAALCIQIGTNFANDYFDHYQGADTEDRKGPQRALQAGAVSPKQMLLAAILMFAMALVFCGYLVYVAGWPILLLGLISVGCGFWYTAGPLSLAYTGLADLFAFAFFGPIAVAGTYYVQALELPLYVILAGMGPGAISLALLTINNLRDVDEDRAANKRTLAVRFGRNFARCEYLYAMLLAIFVPVFLWSKDYVGVWANLSLLFLIPAWPLLRMVLLDREQGPLLNKALGGTAKLLLIYSVLFSIGVIL